MKYRHTTLEEVNKGDILLVENGSGMDELIVTDVEEEGGIISLFGVFMYSTRPPLRMISADRLYKVTIKEPTSYSIENGNNLKEGDHILIGSEFIPSESSIVRVEGEGIFVFGGRGEDFEMDFVPHTKIDGTFVVEREIR